MMRFSELVKTENGMTDSTKKKDWILSRPSMSPWLKNALTTAWDRDPVDVLNDLEILNHMLRTRSDRRIRLALEQDAGDTPAT